MRRLDAVLDVLREISGWMRALIGEGHATIQRARRRLSAAILLLLALCLSPAAWGQPAPGNGALCATSPICVVDWVPISQAEHDQRRYGNVTIDLLSDRYEYWANDRAAQMVTFLFSDVDGNGVTDYLSGMFLGDSRAVLRLELHEQSSTVPLGSVEIGGGVLSPKLEFLVDLGSLMPGRYRVTASVRDGNGTERVRTERSIAKLSVIEPQPPFPDDGLRLVVPPLSVAGATPSTSYPMTTGVPLPRGTLIDPSRLALYENDVHVPAQFTARARWQKEGSLKWVGLDFTARWDGTTPRSYRIVRLGETAAASAPADVLSVVEESEAYVIDTGAARFEIGRTRFTGIQRAWVRRHRDHHDRHRHDGDDDRNHDRRRPHGDRVRLVLEGTGGPYIVDENGTLYAAAYDPTPEMTLEENGPRRVTVRASGWYTSQTGQKLCRYVTRLSAFAGEAQVRVQHHTIVTYDTNSSTRIADAGFDLRTAYRFHRWRAGGDGIVHEGRGLAAGESIYIHQDKHDRFRLRSGGASLGTAIAEGRRADGWLALDHGHTGVVVFLRDMFQRYPKEIEVTRENAHAVAPGTTSRVVVHFWPRHGEDTFSDAEELTRENISKLLWAHEGKFLDLKAPQRVLDELRRLHDSNGPDKGWDADQATFMAGFANAQGVAFGGTFVVELNHGHASDEALVARAALHQQAPHALPPGDWNAATGVEERLSGRDPARFPAAERLLELSFPGYQRYIVDNSGDYGMWIYGNVHNAIDPARGVPLLHRLRQNSHYRNVFAAWLLYLRGGDPEMLRWARANTDNYQDVGIIHHDKVDSAGGIEGDIYHVGFVPWGSGADTSGAAHWADISGPLLNYYLTGDGRGWDVVTEWGRALARKGRVVAAPPAPKPCEAWGNDTYLRNHVTAMGELLRYYQATFDPQALVQIHEISRQLLEQPWECMFFGGGFTIFHSQWFMRYWHQTRDPRLVNRMLAWHAAVGDVSLSANAFLYELTGDTRYLSALLPTFYDEARVLYDDPTDRFHGYSFVAINASTFWLQEAPYFMRALTDAGMAEAQGQREVTAVHKMSSNALSQASAFPPAGWSNASLSVLILPDRDFDIVLGGLTGHLPGPGGEYYVYAPPAPPDPAFWFLDAQRLPVSGSFTGNPTQFPIARHVSVGVVDDLYRLECVGYCPFKTPVSRYADAPGVRPYEALVLKRTRYSNGNVFPDFQWGGDRVLYYLRPVDPNQVVHLEIEASPASNPHEAAPAYVRLEDRDGRILVDTSLFHYGQRRTTGVLALDPRIHPMPWRLYASSRYGPQVRLVGQPDELLLGLTPEDIDAVAGAVNR